MMNENIPTELVLEIFARIPLKSIFQIRCICKHWYNLINDPSLPTMHLVQSTTSKEEEALILTHWFHAKHRKSTLKFMRESHNYSIIDFPNKGRYDLENSCHGLLCFAKCGKEEEAIVSNPLKGELHILPPSSTFSNWPQFTRYGLGFDSLSKTYKIVRVFFRDFGSANRSYELRAEAYTMGTTGRWREIFQVPHYPLCKRGVFVYTNGILYWLVNYEFSHDDLDSMVVSFDFKKEEFSSIPHGEFS